LKIVKDLIGAKSSQGIISELTKRHSLQTDQEILDSIQIEYSPVSNPN